MIVRLLSWVTIGVLLGCAAAFGVGRFANAYEGGYLVGAFWMLILVVIAAGGLFFIIPRGRALGAGFTILALGLVAGFGFVSTILPTKELTTTDIHGGQHIRVVFQSEATEREIEAFLCAHVYRDCNGADRAFTDGIFRLASSSSKEVLVWTDLSRQRDFVLKWRHVNGVHRVEIVP